jgi:phospholipase/carboxylesterase
MTIASSISRRAFLAAAGAAPLALAAACSPTEPRITGPARLRLQARKRTRDTLLGTDVLYGEEFRRAYIRVPNAYNPATPAPLIIAFHGNGGRGDTLAAAFGTRTDALGAIVLAPNSATLTWGMIEGSGFEPDIPFINDVLDQTFDRCNIDASRIGLLGFSDGASYAITLGLSNGDQLAGTTAFSPGFYQVSNPQATPSFFVSHGTNDQVLPIDQTSRKIVPELRARGCNVTYVEFDGGHSVSSEVADQAMSWLNFQFLAAQPIEG